MRLCDVELLHAKLMITWCCFFLEINDLWQHAVHSAYIVVYNIMDVGQLSSIT